MKLIYKTGFVAALITSVPAYAQTPDTVRDLDSLSPVTLTKLDLDSLLPGAKMTRVVASGNVHIWSNDSDGTFVVSSSNQAGTGRGGATSARGKWHISGDGRYCVLIQWRTATDEWCRFLIRTTQGYYLTKAVTPAHEKIYKVEISK